MRTSDMRRHILILMVLGVAFFGLQVAAMAAPNFAGSWVRDGAKSEPVPNALMLNRAPAPQGGGGAAAGRGNAPQAGAPAAQGGGAAQAGAPSQAGAPAQAAAPAARAGGGGGRGNGPSIVMEQDATALTVNDPQNGYRKYPMDGKPITRRTEQWVTNATVTGTPQGNDTMVFTTTQPYGGMPGNNTLTVKEVWTLSPDGKVLTVTTTRSIPAIEKTYKQVYNKQ